jgi:hypothetical protein
MMFMGAILAAAMVYYFIRGKKKSSVRYTPNGNAYVIDGSGYTYAGMPDEPKKAKLSGTTILNYIFVSFMAAMLLFAFVVDVKNGKSGMGYILILVGVIVIFIAYHAVSQAQSDYLAMLTPEEYAKKYPSCKTAHGYSCYNCGSRSIRNWGLNTANDKDRVFICNHCNTHLYRN